MIQADRHGWNTKPHDDEFIKLVNVVKKRINEKNDDYLLLCVGETGTGKSTLMLHAMDIYNPELSVDYIGLNIKDHAIALKNSKDYNGFKFCAYDEANIQKRNSTTRYNKELIDVYMAIRGLKIFHWWNNPSLDIIDKFFVQEKINGIIYIQTKDAYYPRVYFFFTKDDILKIYEKHKKLTLQILKKCADEYATYRGWFRSYNGRLWNDYCKKKDERMESKVEDFFEKYAKEDRITKLDASRNIGVSEPVIYRRIDKLKKKNEWIPDEDVVFSGSREWITKKGLEKLKSLNKYDRLS